MKTFIVHYYVGEDRYWIEIEADNKDEATHIFFDSIGIVKITKENE